MGVAMDKYYVKSIVKMNGQVWANLERGDEIKRIDLSAPFAKPQVGDVVKVFRCRDCGLDQAYSYTLDGKRHVELMTVPLSNYSINTFYDKLSFWDAFRLNRDIKCILVQRNIKPTWNKANNLRMFLRDPFYPCKTH